MKTRRAYPNIIYEGVNITSNLKEDIKSFSYIDVASGEADTIQLIIQDKDKKWLSSWAPATGDNIQAYIKVENWRNEGNNNRLNCGEFIVDQPRHTGRPITLELNAISMPTNTNFTTTKKSRSWDKATIQEVASTISEEAKLNLVFDAGVNPTIDFLEQSEVSDKNFLDDLCVNYGLSMKLYSHQIVIFDEAEYESKDSVITVDENEMDRWEVVPSLTDTGYDGVEIDYFDPDTEEYDSYQYIIPGRSGEKILYINDIVFNLAEAERKAKGELRKANKNETKLEIVIPGDVRLIATNNINITGLGKYSGKYYADKITHQLKPYQLQIELHKVLEGY